MSTDERTDKTWSVHVVKHYQASKGNVALTDTAAPGTPKNMTPSGRSQAPHVCVCLHGRPRTDDPEDRSSTLAARGWRSR